MGTERCRRPVTRRMIHIEGREAMTS